MSTGLYLGNLVDAYTRARTLEEESARRFGQQTGQVFQIDQYLKDLEKENEAQSILADVLRQRQQPQPMGATPMPGAAPPGGPMIPPPPPGLPPAPPPGPAVGPMMPGQPSPTTMPGAIGPRPPALDAILGGLRPEQQASFMTSRIGAKVLPALEESERERRKEEDREKAQEAFGKAKDALAQNDPAGWADYMAMGYRYLGEGQNSARMMEHAAKARTDKMEMEQAPQDFESILGAVNTWKADPTPANLANITAKMREAKSTTAKILSTEMMKGALAKSLDRDPEKEAMFRHFIQATGLRRMDPKQAWAEVVQKFPAGAAKVWAEALIAPDKVHMPQEFWDVLRVAPPTPTKDPTVGQRAMVYATQRAAKMGIAANLADPAFLRIVDEERTRLTKDEAAAKRDPEVNELQKVRLEIARKRLEAVKNPDAQSDKEIRLQLATIANQLKAHESGAITLEPEDLAQLKESQRFYIDLQSQRRAEQGGKGPEAVAQEAKRARAMAVVNKLFPGKTWDQLTPAEKQKVASQVK